MRLKLIRNRIAFYVTLHLPPTPTASLVPNGKNKLGKQTKAFSFARNEVENLNVYILNVERRPSGRGKLLTIEL